MVSLTGDTVFESLFWGFVAGIPLIAGAVLLRMLTSKRVL
jgi:hypothetical protein